MKEGVDKLFKANFINEARYPEELANVVKVKKVNGKWRMCVNFTDLNKVYLRDSFSLSRIDQLVDAIVGHRLSSFVDAYSGYNQIRITNLTKRRTPLSWIEVSITI